MRRSAILFVILSLCGAAVFVRLGIWQLDRLGQRRARNAIVSARAESAPVPIATLSGDSATLAFRRVTVSGTPDFDHDFLLTLRGHAGSPGVDLVTPVRIPGSDSAVLVVRGWVYAPDGMTADIHRWHEEATSFSGYVETFDKSTLMDSMRNNGIRRMAWDAITRTLPYPVRKLYVVATGDSARNGGQPTVVRLEPPPLDEGPHLNYAFQWFAFALIAVVGGGIAAARSMRRSPA